MPPVGDNDYTISYFFYKFAANMQPYLAIMELRYFFFFACLQEMCSFRIEMHIKEFKPEVKLNF